MAGNQKMTTKFKIKLYTLLLSNIALLMGLNVVMLQDGLFQPANARSEEVPMETFGAEIRFAPGEKNDNSSQKNLSIASFVVSRTHDSGRYLQSDKIEAVCEIKNTGSQELNNFRSLIRTPTKEVISEHTNSLKPDETITFSGKVSLEEVGIIIIACRADVDKKIEEESEQDNRAVRTMYVGTGT